jgi:hypothetical protein
MGYLEETYADPIGKEIYTKTLKTYLAKLAVLIDPKCQMSDEELRVLIFEAEREQKLVTCEYTGEGEGWVITGDIPNELTYSKGHFTSKELKEPDCFGCSWDGQYGLGTPECQACQFSPVCFEKTAKNVVSHAYHRWGMHCSRDLVQDMLQTKNFKLVDEYLQRMFHRVTYWPDTHRPKDIQLVSFQQLPPLVDIAGGGAEDGLKKISMPEIVPIAKEQVGESPNSELEYEVGPYGKHTCIPRYLRECKKNELINKLSPGTILKVHRLGKEFVCKVVFNGYLFEGKKYPTLGDVTRKATGSKYWRSLNFWYLK